MAASSTSSSSSSTADPASMINCTIKIQNLTSKPELNSQIGIVQSYNTQNNRYIIQITSPPANDNANATSTQQQQPRQVCVALKIENIKEASTVDKMRGQYYIFLNVLSYMNKNKSLLWNDAKTKFNFTIEQLVRSGVLPPSFSQSAEGGSGGTALKLEYVIGSIVVALLAIIYKVGLTKTIFFFSAFGILLTVAFPDLMAAVKTYNRNNTTSMKEQLKMVVTNFPIRWREMIHSHSGYNANPKIANGLLIALLLLSGKILFTPLGTKGVSSSGTNTLTQTEINMMKQGADGSMNTNPRNVDTPLYTIEEIYRLGFEDASKGRDFGLSLPENHETLHVTSKTIAQTNFESNTYSDIKDSDIQFDYDDYQPTTPPLPPTKRGSGIGFGTLMSMFALFRSVKEMGFVNGRFELQYFISNVQSMPPMKMAFMGFMVYRIVSAFM